MLQSFRGPIWPLTGSPAGHLRICQYATLGMSATRALKTKADALQFTNFDMIILRFNLKWHQYTCTMTSSTVQHQHTVGYPSLVAWWHGKTQGSVCVCAKPMRDNVTIYHRLSLARRIHKMIPVKYAMMLYMTLQWWTQNIDQTFKHQKIPYTMPLLMSFWMFFCKCFGDKLMD